MTASGYAKRKLPERSKNVNTIQYHKGVLDPDTGWMITPQEAYLPEEWDELSRECPECGDDFVIYTSGDLPENSGRPSGYCSPECRQDAHRRESREWARKNRARG
jgi:hypothetical protein